MYLVGLVFGVLRSPVCRVLEETMEPGVYILLDRVGEGSASLHWFLRPSLLLLLGTIRFSVSRGNSRVLLPSNLPRLWPNGKIQDRY